ncbi:MAG: DNA polymerase III subunit alpha [Bdellovibrionota bacterium]
MSFVHLHLHSEFSLSQSLIKLDKLVPRVNELGMSAVAVTDWGNLYGALHFQKACKSKAEGKVKPIYGLEIGVEVEGTGPFHRHMVLLAESTEGFWNLCRLSTRAHTEFGFQDGEVRPYLPLDVVLKHNEGLIALTGGMKGVINSFLLQDQPKEAAATLDKLIASFGPDRLFLELQDNGLSPQMKCNEQLVTWAKQKKLPIVATCDAHYMSRDDAFAHEIWLMVDQKLSLEQNPRSALVSQEFYVKSPEEMQERFSHLPEAIENTVKIAERCNVKLKFSDKEGKRIYHLPDFKREGFSTADEIFRNDCAAGLKVRMGQNKISGADKEKPYWDRLDYEMAIIAKMGFAGYYLIVSDFVTWAKDNGIPVGPGRGSGAGSLCAWVLNITDLDPIEFGLLFERFLNPERVSMPDFDIDFCQERRHEVIRYVAEKYGRDRVCQIVTYAKEQSKNAIKDVGRVLGLSFADTNRITKLIPIEQAKPLSIEESLEKVEELRQITDDNPKVKQTIDIGIRIEGSLRQAGVHAAGVIIAGQPLVNLSPLSRDVNGNLICQWDMKTSEEAGLVKFDFLGLVTLDLMDLACRWVNKRSEPESKTLNYQNIPIHDPRIYELVAKGDTLGVFQLESGGMQNLCIRMKPDRFADISAIAALFRPGPLEAGMVDDYINRKHGKSKVEVMFPKMSDVLSETYGVIVYQEQVQELAKVIAGYTLGGADLLRRAMGKKDPKEMAAQRSTFVEGSVKNGYPANKAGELFDLIEKFAGYGFNKSHTYAYAMLAAQTGYLKSVYPTEFFTALLTIEKGDTDKLSRYIQDARMRKLQVNPPDVNESMSDFAIAQEGVIRFGLSAIKNVGEAAVAEIIAAREVGGKFSDLFDFLNRVNIKKINKRTMESLIQAGAFDSIAEKQNTSARDLRGLYLGTVEKAMEWASKLSEEREAGQESLFGSADTSQSSKGPVRGPGFGEAIVVSEREMLAWEKQLLGVYVSGSPLDRYLDRARVAGAIPIFDLAEKNAKAVVTIACVVVELREVRVKRGRMAGENMGIIKLEDPSGQVELVSFPEHYKEFNALFKSGSPLLVRAELDFEEDKAKLICGQVSMGGAMAVEDLTHVEEKLPQSVRLSLHLDRVEGKYSVESLYSEIADILRKHRGHVPVSLSLLKSGIFNTQLDLGPDDHVHWGPGLKQELESIISLPGALNIQALH